MSANRPLLAVTVVLGYVACERPEVPSSEAEPGRPASVESLAEADAIDSAAAVQLLTEVLRAGEPTRPTVTFKVAKFLADSAGYQITLFRDPLGPGGGGQARVTRSGVVRDLVRFQ